MGDGSGIIMINWEMDLPLIKVLQCKSLREWFRCQPVIIIHSRLRMMDPSRFGEEIITDNSRDGTTTDRSTVQILFRSDDVSAGQYHSIFAKTDGTLWAFGRNQYGQLGDGTGIDRSVPTQVSGVAGVDHVAAGVYASYYRGGGVFGRNNYGQLGDGTTTERNASVSGSSHFTNATFAPGKFHAFLLKGDNTLMGWDTNNYGQLGNGTTDDNSTPAVVVSSNAMQPENLNRIRIC